MTLRLPTPPSWCCSLPGSRGPTRKGPSRVVENACFCQQPVYSRRELTDSPVGIPKARVAGDQAGVASVPTEQLIAFVTGDQGGNSLRHLRSTDMNTCVQPPALSLNAIVHKRELHFPSSGNSLCRWNCGWVCPHPPSPPRGMGPRPGCPGTGTVFGTTSEGREKVGNNLQSRRQHPLLLVSANPVRIDFISDHIIPLHFPAINKVICTGSWCEACSARACARPAFLQRQSGLLSCASPLCKL